MPLKSKCDARKIRALEWPQQHPHWGPRSPGCGEITSPQGCGPGRRSDPQATAGVGTQPPRGLAGDSALPFFLCCFLICDKGTEPELPETCSYSLSHSPSPFKCKPRSLAGRPFCSCMPAVQQTSSKASMSCLLFSCVPVRTCGWRPGTAGHVPLGPSAPGACLPRAWLAEEAV